MKKILFITGTRADYGKLKSLMRVTNECKKFNVLILVTGMHMLKEFGSTYVEIEKDGFPNIYKIKNHVIGDKMSIVLSNSIIIFSNFFNKIKPDLIIIHGDRVEALAGAIAGALNNILVGG
jgi:UDP-N-acetylglucosamine 2-epimerase (hydrolysing)